MSPEQRNELVLRANVEDDPPSGLLVHMHSPSIPGGDTVSIDVWETAEHYERFHDERITPGVREIAAEAGLESDRLEQTVTSFELQHARIATCVVSDYGDEVRRVATL